MTDKKDKTLRPYQQAAIDALRHAGVADAAKALWMRQTGPLAMLRDWLIDSEGSAIIEAGSGRVPRIEYKGRETNEATKTADLYLSKVLTNPPHPDVADAAWFLIDRTTYGGTGEFAERILRDTSSAGIINDARRHGFNPESDRRLYSGRVVPWELIDAARAVVDLDPYGLPLRVIEVKARLKAALDAL